MKKNTQHIVVVRRSKSSRASHHGGSWKIAYADFMTAMMAFFLVMWLLSSSSPQERQHIAEYFKAPVRVALSNGNKASLSDSVIPGGGPDAIKNDGELKRDNLRKRKSEGDMKKLAQARTDLEKKFRNDPRLAQYQSNLRLLLTEDGLLIQIVDSQERPMFRVGSKQLESYLKDILFALVPVLNELPNRISLTGHTDSLPYVNGEVGYSNWELSADRANALRQTLISGGMLDGKFLRVIGTADTMRVQNTTADNPVNRRISILVLSKEKEASILREDTLLQALPDTPQGQNLKTELNMQPVTSEQQQSMPASAVAPGVKSDGHH